MDNKKFENYFKTETLILKRNVQLLSTNFRIDQFQTIKITIKNRLLYNDKLSTWHSAITPHIFSQKIILILTEISTLVSNSLSSSFHKFSKLLFKRYDPSSRNI